MALKDVTPDAVFLAMREYDSLGQERFLRTYGFNPAREYVLVHHGRSYDSKAIAGAAHGYLPGQAPLAARQFSGGETTVGRLLRRLGFTVHVGGEGLTVARLERLLAGLRVYRTGGVPALYQPITLLWAFSRARHGQPRLASWQETQQQIKELLQWGAPAVGGDRVYYPVAALHNAGLWEIDAGAGQVPTAHGSSIPQRWFDDHQPESGPVQPVYDLVRESSEALAAAVGVVTQAYFGEVDPTPFLIRLGLSDQTDASPMEMTLRDRAAQYQRLCRRADVYWQGRESRRATRTSSLPIRYEDAKCAVLLRSEGHCENPECAGEIDDVTDTGAAILEVDHIHDLALGGDDDPAQMIALCPNCHAVKTRGSTRERLRAVLLCTAALRHQRLADACPGDTGPE